MPRSEQHSELIARLREQALLEGEFELRSGATSRWYFDKYLMESDPDLLARIARELAELLPAPDEFERLGGVALGGVPLVTALSLETGIPAVFVRGEQKDYGTENRIEGECEEGDRVVLVEDVVTSGGACVEGIRALREGGLRVDHVLCVLDREAGGAENIRAEDVDYRPLLTLSQLEPAAKSDS